MALVKVEAIVTFKVTLEVELDSTDNWSTYQQKSYEELDRFKSNEGFSTLEPKVNFKADKKLWQKKTNDIE